MALDFDVKDDIRLLKSPLAEVICQVRFATILEISTEQPVEFQKRIRARFPSLAVDHSIALEVPGFAHSGQKLNWQMSPRVIRFANSTGDTLVSLAQDFFALSTSNYSTWEDFSADLELVVHAVQRVYAPVLVERLGLRYINKLSPAPFGFESLQEIIGLINPSLIGPLVTQTIPMPELYGVQMEFADRGNTMAVRLNAETVPTDPAIILDLDYFHDGSIELANLVETCKIFHKTIYGAFRWALHPDALDTFEPVAKES